jgi:glycosyltransferase involved in cell wall biosynthesis
VTGRFEEALKGFAPDVVHFHNIHHYFSYRAIAISKSCIPAVMVFLTAHDVMSFAYQKLHNFIDYSSTSIPTSFNYHVPWWVNFKDARLRFNPFRNFFIRNYLKQADQIFAVSGALKQALADNGIAGNVSVVHNGIDVESFRQPFDESALRAQMSLVDKKVILFVGRFTPDKGRDVTLAALAETIKTVPSALLLVVGFDAKSQREPVMERLIDELGVREKIVFVPAVLYPEMYKYYRIADVVIVPSIIFDSFPTANLEAMASGKPVVATCFGGSRESVEDGVTGFIVNPIDVNTMASKISSVLVANALASRMGAAGNARAMLKFSLSQQVERYETWYSAKP